MAGSPLRSDVIRVLTTSNGKLLYVEDIARQVQRSEKSVRNCMYNIRQTLPTIGDHIEVLVAGKVWRYNDPSSASDAVPQPPDGSVNGQPVAATVDVPTRTVSAQRPRSSDDDGTGDGSDDDETDVATAPNVNVEEESGRLWLFEELGETDDGHLLVVDESGNPYKLIPLSS